MELRKLILLLLQFFLIYKMGKWKGTLDWTGEEQDFKTGDYYSALRLEVKLVLK